MVMGSGSAVEVSTAAATAVLGFNLLGNSPHRQSTRQRTIRAVGVRGSAAAGDSAVSILVNATEVARLFNTNTGFPNRDDLVAVGVVVPPGAEVAAIVQDAPATNPLNLLIEFG